MKTFPKPNLTFIYVAFIISAATPIAANDPNYFQRLVKENPLFEQTFATFPNAANYIRAVLADKTAFELRHNQPPVRQVFAMGAAAAAPAAGAGTGKSAPPAAHPLAPTAGK